MCSDVASNILPSYPNNWKLSQIRARDLDHGVDAQISTTVDKQIVVSGCNQCHPHGFFLSPSRLTIV